MVKPLGALVALSVIVSAPVLALGWRPAPQPPAPAPVAAASAVEAAAVASAVPVAQGASAPAAGASVPGAPAAASGPAAAALLPAVAASASAAAVGVSPVVADVPARVPVPASAPVAASVAASGVVPAVAAVVAPGAASAASAASTAAGAAPGSAEPLRAVPLYTPALVARMQDTHWYAPRTVEFVRRVEHLQQTLDAHCRGGLVMPVRQAWRDAMVAWNRLSTVAIGPLLERESAQRIDTHPIQPELLEKLLAAGEGTPDLATLDRQAQGFAALEWLLWMQPPQPVMPLRGSARNRGNTRGAAAQPARKPAAKPATKPAAKPGAKPAAKRAAWDAEPAGAAHGTLVLPAVYQPGRTPAPFVQAVDLKRNVAKPKPAAKPANAARANAASRRRGGPPPGSPAPGKAAAAASRTTSQPAACKLAQALAAGLHTESMALAEGMARRLEQRLDAPAASRRLDELYAQWLAGLEVLRVEAVEDPLQNKSDKPRARAELPRLLSGSSALDRQARWSALRTLAVQEGPMPTATGAALVSLETWLRSRDQEAPAQALHQAALALDKALEQALDNAPEGLLQAAQAMAQLRGVMADQVVPLLKEASTVAPAAALPVGTAPAPAQAVVPAAGAASAPAAPAPASAPAATRP